MSLRRNHVVLAHRLGAGRSTFSAADKRPNRSHIDESWSRYQLRSLQIILQATHGVISGAPDFQACFWDRRGRFPRSSALAAQITFNRDWYEKLGGQGEFDEFKSTFPRINEPHTSKFSV
jgi:hypothetical protein